MVIRYEWINYTNFICILFNYYCCYYFDYIVITIISFISYNILLFYINLYCFILRQTGENNINMLYDIINFIK